jgi:hypothetical protein
MAGATFYLRSRPPTGRAVLVSVADLFVAVRQQSFEKVALL